LETYGDKLACAIPGLSVHTDLSVSIGLGKVAIEPWAIEIACKSLEEKTKQLNDSLLETVFGRTRENSWDRIKLLNALVHMNQSSI
jgi:hypothetical protein